MRRKATRFGKFCVNRGTLTCRPQAAGLLSRKITGEVSDQK